MVSPLDIACEEFQTPEERTAVTVVDRVTSAELLAARGGRRPEDAVADRITLFPGGRGRANATFWGSSAWAHADLMLVAWAETLRLGRAARVEFEVRFGDGTVYAGEIQIERGIRRGRARLAEQCKRLETFAACFCPEATLPADREKVAATLDYFLKNYEVGGPVAATRTRRSTPVSMASRAA